MTKVAIPVVAIVLVIRIFIFANIKFLLVLIINGRQQTPGTFNLLATIHVA